MLLRFCHIVEYEGELRRHSVFVFFLGGGGGGIPLQQFGQSSGQSGHMYIELPHHILIFNNPQIQYFLIFQAFKYPHSLSFYT